MASDPNPYFTALAPEYERVTGNITSSILAQVLRDETIKRSLKLNGYCVVHDNAAGPGTATSVIVKECLDSGVMTPEIYLTDENPTMTAEAEKLQKNEKGWDRVTISVNDSAKLEFKDDFFTHSFTNFSVYNFKNPLLSLRHVHRTLRPKGVAIVTCWKRFPLADLIKEATKIVKGGSEISADTQTMTKVAGDEFMEEGYLVKMVDQAGWERGKIREREFTLTIKEGTQEYDGLVEFMTGKFTEPARKDLSSEEKEKWDGAIKEALQQETSKNGGIKFEARSVLAMKWDALAG